MARDGVDAGVDLDDLDDLDAPGTPAEGAGTPAPPRRGWLRSRWTLPVLVLVAVLALQVAVGRQQRASAADELASAVRLSSVQVGSASVVSAYTGGPATFDERGRMLTEVQVQVLNSGQEPVGVAVRSTSEPLLALLDPPARTSVGPGASDTLVLQAAVDCSRVPPLRQSYVPAEQQVPRPFSVDLDVTGPGAPDGPGQRHRYLVNDATWGWGDVAQQLTYACDPASTGAVSMVTEPRDDGLVRVQVTNDASRAVTVGLEQSPWLRASSDVQLPAEVPAHGSLTAVLGLDPDCRQAPAPSHGGLDVHVDLAVLEPDGTSRTLPDQGGPTRTSAWAARQAALACG